MRGRGVRPSWAWVVVCALIAGCNCGDTTLRELSSPPVVETLTSVSCNGASVRITPLITGGRAPFRYEWAPADGLSDPHAASPIATVTETRLYTVTVTDAKGRTAEAVSKVEYRRLPTLNVAFAQGAAQVCSGTPVELDASASRDQNGAPLKYFYWELGSSTPSPDPSSARSGAFTPTDGQFIRLRASDALGCEAVDDRVISVRNRPAVQISFLQGSSEMCSGEPVQLLGIGTDADGQPVPTLEWDLDGDASTVERTGVDSTLFAAGVPTVSLRATDALGCSSSVTQTMTINPLPTPEIRFASGAADACDGSPITLDASASINASSFEWDLDGDASTVEASNALVPVTSSGSRVVTLKAISSKGCAATTTQPLAARPLPKAEITFAQGRPNVCLGDAVSLSARTSLDADGLPVTGYAWDLDGDGQVDSLADISPAFTPSAAQSAHLVVTDSKGCQSEASQLVDPRALPTPRVDFVQGSADICAGDSVRLNASASTDADGSPLTAISWDLDGNSATTEANGVDSGVFTPAGKPVRATVTDTLGCSASASVNVAVTPLPKADIRFQQGASLVCNGAMIAVDASASSDFAGQAVARVEWDLDGDASTIESTSVAPPAFAASSSRPLQLKVFDAKGCSNIATQPVAVRALPQARIAFVQGRQNVCLGDGVQLSGASSTDADGQPVTEYGWDVDGDGAIDQTAAQTSSLTPSSNMTAKLFVTDSLGCRAEAIQAITPRALPTLSVSFTQGEAALCAGDSVSLDAVATDADGNSLATFAWDLDGNASTVESRTASTGSFAPAGTPATVRVTDALGCTKSHTQLFDIGALPTPAIRIVQGASLVCQGDQVGLDASTSKDASGNAVASFEWDFDGDPSTIESAQTTPPALTPNGTVPIRLRVTDARGCSAVATTTVASRALPQARIAFAEGRQNVCLGDSLKLSGAASTDADGQPVASYGWDLDGDGTIDQSAAQTTSIAPFANQTAKLVVADAMGCRGEATQAITPRALPTLTVAFTQGSSTLCSGDAVSLKADATDADGNALAAFAWDLDGNTSTVESTTATTGAFAPTGTPATVRVTDGLGCTSAKTQLFDIGALPTPAIRIVQGASLVCQGDQVGLDASTSKDASGNPVASFEWDLDAIPSTVESTVATPPTLTPNGTLPVRLRVTDARGCSAVATTTVASRALPQARIAFAEGRQNVCLGDSIKLSGAASTDADGQPVTSYGWDLDGDGAIDQNASVTASITPSSSQTAKLVVADSMGCRAEATQAITPRALPIPVLRFAAGSSAICSGDQVALDGSDSIDADGNPVTNLAWDLDGNAATAEATGDNTGLFQPGPAPVGLSVTDAFGCRMTLSQPITTHQRPTARIDYAAGSSRMCEGLSVTVDGSASSDAVGGQVVQYAWDLDGDTSTIESTQAQPPSLTPLGSRPLHLTVTDANGCTAEAFDLLTMLPRPTARMTFAQGSQNACLGSDVALSGGTSTDASGNAIARYEWDFDGDPSTVESSSATPASISLSTPRAVQLKVIDANGCEDVVSQMLAPRGLPTPRIAFDIGRANVCLGGAVALSGAASTDADGNPVQSYYWQADDLSVATSPSDAATPAFVPLQSQEAKLIVVDAMGCQAEATQPLAPRGLPTPIVRFSQGANAICSGETVALDAGDSHDVDGNPVAAYDWDLDGNGATVESNGLSSGLFQPPSVPVQLAVTDALGCRSTLAQEIITRPRPVARIAYAAGASDVCLGSSLTLDASSSTDAFGAPVASFAWDLDGNAATIESNLASPPALWPTSSHEVRLTVRDANGCTSDAYDLVSVLPLPVPAIRYTQGGVAVCSGTNVAVDGSPSRDAFGQPVARYEWDLDGNASTIESTAAAPASFVATSTHPMTLRVFDTNGCTAATSQSVSARALPQADIAFAQGRSNVCAGGVVSLTGAASRDADGQSVASYAWDLDSDGTVDQTSATTNSFTPTGPRTANLTVTDALGCSSVASQAIAPRALPIPTIDFAQGGSLLCSGQSVRFTGTGSRDADGNTVVSYGWDLDSNGSIDETSGTTSLLTPTSNRVASLTVTDAQGCTATATTPVTVRALPTPRITIASGTATMCAGAELSLSGATTTDADGQPAESYAWDLDSNGSTDMTTASTGTFTPSSDGAASLRVTDSFGCSASTTQPIVVRPVPVVDAGPTRSLCPGATVSIGAAASAGNSYLWSPATGLSSSTVASPTASPSSTTTYSLQVTNQYGCTATGSTSVTVFPQPVADAGPDRQMAFNGSVQLLGTATSGTPNYSYAWTPATNLSSASIAQPVANPSTNRTYALTVTDANGCQATDSMNVQVLSPIALDTTPDQRLCLDGGSNVTISTSANGGVAPLTYQWTASPACTNCIATPNAASTTVSPTTTTTFTVTVTDVNGTQTTGSTTVSVSPTYVPNAGATRTVQTGDLTQLGAAAVPGFSYSWTCNKASCGLSSSTASNPYAAPFGTTVYTVTASDGLTCAGSTTVTVLAEPRVLATVPPEGHPQWPRDAPIFVTFDADVDPSTFASNFWLTDANDADKVYIGASYDAATRTAIITPQTNCSGVTNCTGTRKYRNNNAHELTVEGGSAIGTATPNRRYLKNDFTLAFHVQSDTDGTAPVITYRSPAASSTNVSRNAQIVMRFDEGLDPRTVTTSTLSITGVTTALTYDPASWTVYLKPSLPLAANTTYTVRAVGVKDAKGNATSAVWTFTTGAALDTQAPSVSSTYPANGATGIDVTATLSVSFSEQIDVSTVRGISIVKQSTGMPIPADVVYDPATATATIEPYGFLESNTSYRLDVPAVADYAGLKTPLVSRTFTTQTTLLQERFETSLTGWTLQTPWATHLQSAYTGSKGLSSSPGATYSSNQNTTATLPSINVAGRSSVAVSFWSRLEMATDNDRGLLEYSTNNGSTWTTAATLQGVAGFRVWSYSLPTNGAPTMRVRLHFISDNNTNLGGWFTDELVIR